MSKRPNIRPSAGHRPVTPVRQYEPPAYCGCTWSYVKPVWSTPVRTPGVWELKYINAACLEHARLPAA